MANNDKSTTHITRDDCTMGDEEGARERFLEQLEALAKNIRSGRTKIRHGLLAFTAELREEDLPADLPADKREKLLAHLGEAGHQEITGIGPGNELLDLVSELPAHFSAPLLQEHNSDCHDPDCALNDPEIGQLVGPLKCMAKTIGRVAGNGNEEALKFLLQNLKDMCRKAAQLHAMGEVVRRITEENGEEALEGAVTVAGDQAVKVMRALADAGVLPPEVADRVRNDLEAETDLSTTTEIPEGSTLVRGDSKIKH